MKPETVQVNHTYWTIMTNQHGASTTMDSIILVPVFVLYTEPDLGPGESGRLCACAALDSNGKIPEPLPIRQVREAFLYETFDEAWDKLHEDMQEGLKALDKLREDAQAQGSDLGGKDHMLLTQLNSLRQP